MLCGNYSWPIGRLNGSFKSGEQAPIPGPPPVGTFGCARGECPSKPHNETWLGCPVSSGCNFWFCNSSKTCQDDCKPHCVKRLAYHTDPIIVRYYCYSMFRITFAYLDIRIRIVPYLLNKIIPKNQNVNDDLYLVKVTLYYFFLWYIIAWTLFYLIYKNF